jgi:hypothetical protein
MVKLFLTRGLKMDEKIETLKSLFEPGKKYSLFYIDDFMAMTHKTEITVLGIRENDLVFQAKKGRKKFLLPFSKRHYQSAPITYMQQAVFDGWDLPFICDTEQIGNINAPTISRGDANMNLVGDPDIIQICFETRQLNPYFDKTRIVVYPVGCIDSDYPGVNLYKEVE